VKRIARVALALLVLAVACGGTPSFADDPPPAVRFGFTTWSGVALGRPDTSVRYGLQGDVQGPLVVGERPQGDLGLSLSIETLPAKNDTSLADLNAWDNVAQVTGWLGKRVGDAQLGAQHVSSSIVVEGRFSSAFFDAAAEPQRKRFYRSYGLGVQATLHLAERDAFFRLAYCRDEAVGVRGVGQVCVSGELPTIKDVRIYARAGLGVGASSLGGEQADYIVLGIGRPW
jgi:hypothetical protein